MQHRITELLAAALTPSALEVIDESHLHAGHAGARAGGETHYRVRIVADAFDGRTRLERHRMVNEALAAPLRESVHALAIEARSTSEPAPAVRTVRGSLA